MRELRCCVWELTLACNLRCLHCGATAGVARPDELTTAEALEVADDLAALSCQEVTLMGGELFMRSDWADIARRLRTADIGLVIFTNGWLLDQQRISRIQNLKPRTVGLSLDGASAQVHDRQRGVNGSFERVWKAVHALREAHLPTSVITTLTRHNLYELPALGRRLLGQGVQWQVQIATHNGARMTRADQLTPLEFYWAACWVSLIRSKYEWPVLPVAGAHDLGYHSARLGNVMPPGCTWAGCSAGLDTLGIQSNGSVKGCLSLSDDFVEGNVRDRPLRELWRDHNAFARNRHFEPATLGGFCATCPHGSACRGGCLDLAHSASGTERDNPYCLYRLEETYQPGSPSPRADQQPPCLTGASMPSRHTSRR